MAKSAVPSRVDYAAEKAAAHARKQAAWASAEAEFTAWYQDLGTRAEKTTGGHAGVNRGKTLTTAPKCFCGKATTALGLCENHYSQWWRSAHGQRGFYRLDKQALCHPDRVHHAMGLCRPCYESLPQTIARRRVQKLRDNFLSTEKHPTKWKIGGVPATNCRHTDKRAQARGLCAACYKWHREHGSLDQFKVVRVRKRCRKHPDRPVYARGFCQLCYLAWWKKRKVTAQGRQQRIRLEGMPLVCGHNDRPHAARDMCRPCYSRWYNANKRRDARSRTRMPRGAKIILCGHHDRKYYARCCCWPCYLKRVFDQPDFRRRLITDFPAAMARYEFQKTLAG